MKSRDLQPRFLYPAKLSFRIEGQIKCFPDKKKLKEPWLVWLSVLSAGLQTKGLPIQFPVRANAWVTSQVPNRGHMSATTH